MTKRKSLKGTSGSSWMASENDGAKSAQGHRSGLAVFVAGSSFDTATERSWLRLLTKQLSYCVSFISSKASLALVRHAVLATWTLSGLPTKHCRLPIVVCLVPMMTASLADIQPHQSRRISNPLFAPDGFYNQDADNGLSAQRSAAQTGQFAPAAWNAFFAEVIAFMHAGTPA